MRIIGNVKLRDITKRSGVFCDETETLIVRNNRILVFTTAESVLEDRKYNKENNI
jgi:hypothetical protein